MEPRITASLLGHFIQERLNEPSGIDMEDLLSLTELQFHLDRLEKFMNQSDDVLVFVAWKGEARWAVMFSGYDAQEVTAFSVADYWEVP
jgi:hypothetical protein